MRPMEPLALPLWKVLQEAAIAPGTANLEQLLTLLEVSLTGLDTSGQLQVAAEAIAQIVQVFHARSTLAFEALTATTSQDGPCMPTDAFDRYVRQIVEVDLDQFIEPLASLPRKPLQRQEGVESGSVVGELDRAIVLQTLDELMRQEPSLTEAEIFNRTLELAHEEDIAGWAEKVWQWMQQHQTAVPLTALAEAIQLPLINVWLGILVGSELVVEQRGVFYDPASLWVVVPSPKLNHT